MSLTSHANRKFRDSVERNRSPVLPTETGSAANDDRQNTRSRKSMQEASKTTPSCNNPPRQNLAVLSSPIDRSPMHLISAKRPSKILPSSGAVELNHRSPVKSGLNGKSSNDFRSRIPSTSSFCSGVYDNVHNNDKDHSFATGATGTVVSSDGLIHSPVKKTSVRPSFESPRSKAASILLGAAVSGRNKYDVSHDKHHRQNAEIPHQFSQLSVNDQLPAVRSGKIRSKSVGRHASSSRERLSGESTDDEDESTAATRTYADCDVAVQLKNLYSNADVVLLPPKSPSTSNDDAEFRRPSRRLPTPVENSHSTGETKSLVRHDLINHSVPHSLSTNSFPDVRQNKNHGGTPRHFAQQQHSLDLTENKLVNKQPQQNSVQFTFRNQYEENILSLHATSPTQQEKLKKDLHRKRLYRVGLNLFNTDVDIGLKFLGENGFVGSSARQVARFLRVRKGLSKNAVGEFLSRNPNDSKHNGAFAHQVLKCFLTEVDFIAERRFDDADQALRHFISFVNLSGEAQRIDRFIDAFAAHLFSVSAQIRSVFNSELSLQCFCFALIMLNTDLHHPRFANSSSRSGLARAMKFDEFVTNLKQALPNNDTLDIAYLRRAYENIQRKKLEMGDDHVSQVRQLASRIVAAGSSYADAVLMNLVTNRRRLVCFCRLYCQALATESRETEDRRERVRNADSARKRISSFASNMLTTSARRRQRSKSASSIFGRRNAKFRPDSIASGLTSSSRDEADGILPISASQRASRIVVVEQLNRAQREVFLFNDLLLITQQKQQQRQRKQERETAVIITKKNTKVLGQSISVDNADKAQAAASTMDIGEGHLKSTMDETFFQWYELKAAIDLHSLRSVELFESHSEPFGVRLISNNAAVATTGGVTGDVVMVFGARNASDRDNFSNDLMESIAETALTSQMLEECKQRDAERKALADGKSSSIVNGVGKNSPLPPAFSSAAASSSSSSSISRDHRHSVDAAYSTASSSLSALSSSMSLTMTSPAKSPTKAASHRPTNFYSSSKLETKISTNFATAVVGTTPAKAKHGSAKNPDAQQQERARRQLRMSSSSSNSTASPISTSLNSSSNSNGSSNSSSSSVDHRL